MGTELDVSKKALIKKPDTWFGIVALAGFVGWGILKLLPILTAIVWNTINFGIACVVGGILLYILTNKKTWLLLHYLHELTLKKLFSLVIETDPFIIAEDYIRDMEKERENVNQKNIELGAQKEALELKLAEKEKEKKSLIARAKAAEKNHMQLEIRACAEEIQFIDDFIKQLTPLRENLTKLGNFFDKVYENSAYTIRSAKAQLNIKKQAYEMVTKSESALKAGLKLLNGDPDKKFLMEQSMESLKNDIGLKLSGMKNSLKISSEIMNKIDLDRASFQESGLALLEQYNPEDLKLNEPEKVPVSFSPGKVNKVAYKDLLD